MELPDRSMAAGCRVLKPSPRFFLRCLAHVALLSAVLLPVGRLARAADAAKSFDVPTGEALTSLRQFSTQSREQLFYLADAVKGVTTFGIKGVFTSEEALARMLKGTGLVAKRDEKTGAFTISRSHDPNANRAALTANRDRPNRNQTTPANTHNMDNHPHPPAATRLFNLLTAFLAGSVAVAGQTDATSDRVAKEKEEALVMSPFSVSTKSDRGYITANTLSGIGIDTPIMKLPQTIQVANQELIQDLALGSGDLLKAIEMASGSIVRRSHNNGDDQFMWGFRLNFSLRDGVPVGFTNPMGQLYDIDRIEAIKGPAAALFGQASFVGGLLNYVPRAPSRTPKYFAEASIGSLGHHSGALHAAGPITKALRYRADIGATEKDGRRLFTFYKDKFVGGALEYDVADATTINIEGHSHHADRRNTTTVLEQTRIDGRFAQPSLALGERTVNAPSDNYGTDRYTFTTKLKTIVPGGIASQTFVNWTEILSDMNRTQAGANGAFDIPGQLVGRLALRFYVNEHNWYFQQNFSKDVKTGLVTHKLGLNADTRFRDHFETVNFFGIDPLIPGFSLVSPDYSRPLFRPANATGTADSITKERTRLSGASVQDVASLWNDRVNVLYSIRYSDMYQTTGIPIAGFQASTPPQTVAKGDTTTRRYGITVTPLKDVMVYYNRGQAFVFNSGLDYLDHPLVPSLATNGEFGVKTNFFDGALTVTVARFDIEVSNVRVVFTQGPNDPLPGSSGIKQDGSQFNKGWDVTLNGHKRFDAGVSNLILTYYSGDIRDERGLKPGHAVNNTSSAWGTFQFSQAPLKGFKLGLGANFIGERVGPTLSAAAGALPTRIRSWTNYRAMVGYSWKHLTLQVNGDNLADKREIDGFESGFWITTDPGRVYRFSATYTF